MHVLASVGFSSAKERKGYVGGDGLVKRPLIRVKVKG